MAATASMVVLSDFTPRYHGAPCLQHQHDSGRGVETAIDAREASDKVDQTASWAGYIVNHGRDSIDGGGRHLHPHDTTSDPACSVSVTLAEVWTLLPRSERPLTRSFRPHLAWAT
jgi:hypothetical protein